MSRFFTVSEYDNEDSFTYVTARRIEAMMKNKIKFLNENHKKLKPITVERMAMEVEIYSLLIYHINKMLLAEYMATTYSRIIEGIEDITFEIKKTEQIYGK